MPFTNIVPQQTRGPVTNQRSPSQTANVAAGHTTEFGFRFPMAVASIQDSTLSLTYTFQISSDGGTNWRTWIGPETWTGSPTIRTKDGQTVANTILPECAGSLGPGSWQVSLLFTIPVAFSVGLDVNVVPH